MMTLHRSAALAAAALVALAGIARAEDEHDHVDVRPYVADGKISTGGYADGDGVAGPAVIRAFGYDFDDAADPYFVNDPGFNTNGASPLAANAARLGLNVAGPLEYWDGAGDVNFATLAPNGLRFEFGAQSYAINAGTGAQSGMSFPSENGGFHSHLESYLTDANGAPIPFDGTPPADGVYAVLLDLSSNAPGIARSDPFYIVFNLGLDEEQHEAAIVALGATLVPEPATLAAVAGAAVLMLRRRR